MENHIHRFLNKFRPGFGLLRNFRGTLRANAPRDIESGQPEPQDGTTDAAENILQPQNATVLIADQDDHIDSSPANSVSSNINIEEKQPLQPQFTEGLSRFTTAKDGSNDSVALLVSEGFLAKLRDLFQANRDINALDGPLTHAQLDAKRIEDSISRAQESLETVESEEQAEEYRNSIEQQTSELLKINRWKDELEKELSLVEGKLQLSRSHTQWVLETAMRAADYLGPEKPLPTILLRDEEMECAEESVEAPEHDMPVHSSTVSVASSHEEVEVSEEDLQRRAAYDQFVDRSQRLDRLRTKFENQPYNYRENLARFQQQVEAGTNETSRSGFDRRSVRYGQEVTRALIDAEEGFEEARERALALNAISSDYGQDFYYGAEYEESCPENQIAEYLASQDLSFVLGWMDGIPDSPGQADADDNGSVEVEVDEWEAEEVDVNDSISMIDCEDYRQDIDRYRRICARLADPCPDARWLGQPDARPLGRRSSCWM